LRTKTNNKQPRTTREKMERIIILFLCCLSLFFAELEVGREEKLSYQCSCLSRYSISCTLQNIEECRLEQKMSIVPTMRLHIIGKVCCKIRQYVIGKYMRLTLANDHCGELENCKKVTLRIHLFLFLFCFLASCQRCEIICQPPKNTCANI
jgi:hypothetical protein